MAGVNGLLEAIRREVAERGWCHVEQPLEKSAFLDLARALGTIIRCLDVVVDAKKENEQKRTRRKNLNRPSLYQAEGLPLHTDPPDVDILALHCVVPDLHGGDNQLVDASDLDKAFEPEEIECLGRVEVAYAADNSDGTDGERTRPLVDRRGGLLDLFYVPWGVRTPTDEGLKRLLARFIRYLEEKPVIEVRLQPGETLFINNRRMLHGRRSLPQDSRRHLVRVHIRTS
jgi:Taurine catabolism dioxygenase TauD, TfdA family